MFERGRRFLRDESLGITIPVGVTIGFAFVAVLRGFMYAFVLPVFVNWLGDEGEIGRLDFDLGTIHVEYSIVLLDALTLAVLLLVAYWLFIRPVEAGGRIDSPMRECPACKSDIFEDATRCAFCTSPVNPIESVKTSEE